MSRGWIGVDLDGTLAHYDHWVHHTHIGVPIEKMAKRVRDWLSAGMVVKIVTARVSPDQDEKVVNEVRQAIASWCKQHLGQGLQVVHGKDLAMIDSSIFARAV